LPKAYKAPQIVQNIVTYMAVITTKNPDEVLLPGMTANLQVVVAKRVGALKVPNTTLRSHPAGQAAENEQSAQRYWPKADIEVSKC
jgi:HlyD family secretion protein